jgi:hypothetical protein
MTYHLYKYSISFIIVILLFIFAITAPFFGIKTSECIKKKKERIILKKNKLKEFLFILKKN